MLPQTRQKRPMVRPCRSSGIWLCGPACGNRYMALTSYRRTSAGGLQLGPREEEGQLDGGVLGRVAAVDGVALDRRAVELADRPLLGLRHVGGAHGLAQVGDRVLALQRHRDHRTARHEFDQAAVERSLFVHLVEGLRLDLGQTQHLDATDLEPLALQESKDIARVAGLDTVRLQDRQRHLHRIVLPLYPSILEKSGRARAAGRDQLDTLQYLDSHLL